MKYLSYLAEQMLDTLCLGGVISLIATWLVLGAAFEYIPDQVGIYALAFLMFWPIGFVVDIFTAWYLWSKQ